MSSNLCSVALGIQTKAGAGLTSCWLGTFHAAVPVSFLQHFWEVSHFEETEAQSCEVDDWPLRWGRPSGFLSSLSWNHLHFSISHATYGIYENLNDTGALKRTSHLCFSISIPQKELLLTVWCIIRFPCTNTPTHGAYFSQKDCTRCIIQWLVLFSQPHIVVIPHPHIRSNPYLPSWADLIVWMKHKPLPYWWTLGCLQFLINSAPNIIVSVTDPWDISSNKHQVIFSLLI